MGPKGFATHSVTKPPPFLFPSKNFQSTASSSKNMFRTDRENGLGGLRSLDLQLRRLPRYPCCASIMTLRYKPLQKLTCRSFKSVIKVSTNQIVYLVPGWTMCLTPSLKIYNIFEFKAWKPVGGLQIRFFCKFIDVP